MYKNVCVPLPVHIPKTVIGTSRQKQKPDNSIPVGTMPSGSVIKINKMIWVRYNNAIF